MIVTTGQLRLRTVSQPLSIKCYPVDAGSHPQHLPIFSEKVPPGKAAQTECY
jgi:hypothetical protein